MSVYCDCVRWKVWSATSISVWQHVQLSRSVPEIHSHVAGTLSNQQTNNIDSNTEGRLSSSLKFLSTWQLTETGGPKYMVYGTKLSLFRQKTVNSFLKVYGKSLILSSYLILSYLSRSLADRWGTNVDFTTSFLHSSRFSAFSSKMFHSRPVHSLMLSSHRFLCHL